MSKYTTEVRFICEQYYGLEESKGYDDVDTIVTNAANRIFENFPIFDEAYRLPLEKKILRHFYTREICAETVGLWKLWLNNRMSEIMPYYNQLYSSALLEFDPLHDTDYTVDHQGTGSTEENVAGTTQDNGNVSYTKDSTSNTQDNNVRTYDTQSETNETEHTDFTGTGWNYFNDTPQGGVDRIDVQGLSNYLTNARKTTEDNDTDRTAHSTTDTTGTVSDDRDVDKTEHGTNVGVTSKTGTSTTARGVSTTDDYLETITGKRSNMSYSELLLKFRQTFLNIDQMILDDLSDLFFNLW